jgi:hypothetical protein
LGIVSVVAPATADGTNVTVPEVDPGKTIDKIPVKAWLADALFKATAVVPIKNVLLPKTAAEIVPVKLAAVRDVSAAPFPENPVADKIPVEGTKIN